MVLFTQDEDTPCTSPRGVLLQRHWRSHNARLRHGTAGVARGQGSGVRERRRDDRILAHILVGWKPTVMTRNTLPRVATIQLHKNCRGISRLNIIMLSEAKHLNENALRCFTLFSMTWRYIAIHCQLRSSYFYTTLEQRQPREGISTRGAHGGAPDMGTSFKQRHPRERIST